MKPTPCPVSAASAQFPAAGDAAAADLDFASIFGNLATLPLLPPALGSWFFRFQCPS